eukprot:SAG11_NODE_3004_length_2774_cov_1.712897_5_plen_43_part_00
MTQQFEKPFVAQERGYNCVITMAETFSVERRKIMRALGSKVR